MQEGGGEANAAACATIIRCEPASSSAIKPLITGKAQSGPFALKIMIVKKIQKFFLISPHTEVES